MIAYTKLTLKYAKSSPTSYLKVCPNIDMYIKLNIYSLSILSMH